MRIFELTFEELLQILQTRYGKGRYHARAIYQEIFRNGRLAVAEAPAFSDAAKAIRPIAGAIECHPGRIVRHEQDGELIKFVTRLWDGHEIESVIIPMATHNTLCVSSQVGCAVGCRFCQTGQMGFARNLTTEEIVGQVWMARFVLQRPVRNVVFMGMGEPLDNFGPVVQAIRVLNQQRGLDIALRYITLATVGKVQKIKRLAAADLPGLRLAISLNAPKDALRRELMPAAGSDSLESMQQALIRYPRSKKDTIFITYVLIPGVNDSKKDAYDLARFVKPFPAKVNLIPYNPRKESPFAAPSEKTIQRFAGRLIEQGVFIRKRNPKGRDLMAACGQLGKIATALPSQTA